MLLAINQGWAYELAATDDQAILDIDSDLNSL